MKRLRKPSLSTILLVFFVSCAAWTPPDSWIMFLVKDDKGKKTCWVEARQREELWTCQEYLEKQETGEAIAITFAGESSISRHIQSLESQLLQCKQRDSVR